MVVSEEAESMDNPSGNKHLIWMYLYFLTNFGALLPVSTERLSPRNFLYSLLTLSPNNARVWDVLMSAEEEKIQAR